MSIAIAIIVSHCLRSSPTWEAAKARITLEHADTKLEPLESTGYVSLSGFDKHQRAVDDRVGAEGTSFTERPMDRVF